MRKKVKKFFKKTKNKVQILRDKVSQLKSTKQQPATIPVTTHSHKKQPERVIVEFSLTSVAKATLVIIGLYLLFKFLGELKSVMVIVFVSLFLSAALDSIVDQLKRKKIPRSVSVLGIYLISFIILTIFISTLIPLVAKQTISLAKTITEVITNFTKDGVALNLPYADKIQPIINDLLDNIDQQLILNNLETTLQQVASQLQNIAGNTLGAIKVLFNGIFNAILVLVLTFFIIVDEKNINHFIASLFPSRHTSYILEKTDAIKEKIGYWLRGQLKLMLVIAVVTFIGLEILGIEYALTLAVLAGFTELIPVVGPIIAAIPALLVALNDSPMMGLWVVLLYVVIQQLEGNIIVPIVMKQSVGLSPIIIIVAMLIGFQFLGILGVIIAVPVATAISIFIKDYSAKAK